MARPLLVCVAICHLCLVVAADSFCARTCNCTSGGGQGTPIWPEAVAATAGVVAPLVLGGLGYGVWKLASSSSGGFNVTHPSFPKRQGLIKDFDRKASLESSTSSGYDPYKRRQSALSVFDNDDDDFPSDVDLPRNSSINSFTGEDGSMFSGTPRGAPMSRPSFLPAPQSGTPRAGSFNSWM
ncbi:uncharacterized protein [Haliotis cracherodii]|uniref:uncharacterized protein n=1 Tax=Haliotis cracherodii TaxID=6455 RepID=UPI0039EC7CB7